MPEPVTDADEHAYRLAVIHAVTHAYNESLADFYALAFPNADPDVISRAIANTGSAGEQHPRGEPSEPSA